MTGRQMVYQCTNWRCKHRGVEVVGEHNADVVEKTGKRSKCKTCKETLEFVRLVPKGEEIKL